MTIPENIIQSAADCVVDRFMKCAFQERYRSLLLTGDAPDDQLRTAFEVIYAEYVDLAGLYITREFELSAYISSLDTRIYTVKRFVNLQETFLHEFDAPFIPGFALVKKYGHRLYWDFSNPDKEAFKNKLKQIQASESRYHAELNKKVNELVELRKKKVTKTFSLLESRKQFIMSMNRLQQNKYVIDKEKTTMEEMALMIKDYKDTAAEADMQNSIRRNKR
jgi:hypothetical protein